MALKKNIQTYTHKCNDISALSFCLRDSAASRLAPSALLLEILQSPSAVGSIDVPTVSTVILYTIFYHKIRQIAMLKNHKREKHLAVNYSKMHNNYSNSSKVFLKVSMKVSQKYSTSGYLR